MLIILKLNGQQILLLKQSFRLIRAAGLLKKVHLVCAKEYTLYPSELSIISFFICSMVDANFTTCLSSKKTTRRFFSHTSVQTKNALKMLSNIISCKDESEILKLWQQFSKTIDSTHIGRFEGILRRFGMRAYQHPVIRQFFIDYPPASGSYWRGKYLSTVTLEQLVKHALGENKLGPINTGANTKKYLEQYGVDFTHLTLKNLNDSILQKEVVIKVCPSLEAKTTVNSGPSNGQ